MTNYLDKDGLKKFWDITKGKYSPLGHTHAFSELTGKPSGGGTNWFCFKRIVGGSGSVTFDKTINGYVINKSNGINRIQNISPDIYRTSWTVSFWIKAEKACKVFVNMNDLLASTLYNESSYTDVTTEYRHHAYTFLDTGPYGNYNGLLDIENSDGVKIWVKNIKIETGVIATDWSPNPLDADVNSAETATKLGGYSEDKFFRFRGFINDNYVRLTDSSTGLADYINPLNGTYNCFYWDKKDSRLLVSFSGIGGSTTGLEFLVSYHMEEPLYFRRRIDANRISGAWESILTDLNTSISGQTVKINNETLTVPTKLSELTDDVVSGKYLQWKKDKAYYSLSVSTNSSNDVDTGGGVLVEGNTGIPFKLWLHDTSNVWYKQTSGGAWVKMDAGKADQLSTARTLWGQSFDGSGNVDGAMTVNGTIHATGAATLDSTLAVSGNATLNAALSVKGAASFSDKVTGYGNVSLMNGAYLSALNSGGSHYARFTSDGIVFTKKLGDTAKTLALPSKGGTVALAESVLATSGGTVSGVLMVNGAVTLNTTLKVVGNVGIGTDADSAYRLKVNGDAFIQSMRMARWIEADTDQGLVIGNANNEAYVGFCTDLCGFDADGTDNPTIDDYDQNWSIGISGSASFKTLYTNDITIKNAIYVTYNGTRYRLDPAKAMSLGLFVKA